MKSSAHAIEYPEGQSFVKSSTDVFSNRPKHLMSEDPGILNLTVLPEQSTRIKKIKTLETNYKKVLIQFPSKYILI